MPVKIPDDLPARSILQREGVSVIPKRLAFTQDIRPLRVAIMNIMPIKTETETQLLRLLSNSPLQVAVTLLHPRSHTSRNTPPEHLAKFYRSFEQVQNERFDCLIITGAPVETLEFTEVTYWSELCEVMDWSRRQVYSTLHLCWGAQAGMYHHFGIPKQALAHKMFGVFSHTVVCQSPLVCGFDDIFFAPHSRHTGVLAEEILRHDSLKIVSHSDQAGVYIVSTEDGRRIFVTGHPEYDLHTLQGERDRDIAKGLEIPFPPNYFQDDDPSKKPIMRWRSHANLLFTNWLSAVYQNAPFDLRKLTPVT